MRVRVIYVDGVTLDLIVERDVLVIDFVRQIAARGVVVRRIEFP